MTLVKEGEEGAEALGTSPNRASKGLENNQNERNSVEFKWNSMFFIDFVGNGEEVDRFLSSEEVGFFDAAAFGELLQQGQSALVEEERRGAAVASLAQHLFNV